MIALLIVSTLSGCVRRKMTVRSNPPGATVYLDGKEIGRTPFTTNFDHYGKREFRVVKQGYETKTALLSVRAPWYQWLGFDFVSEVLLPGKLTDHQSYEFDMQPENVVLDSEIVSRAEQFRQTAHADGIPKIGGSTTVAPTSVGHAFPITYPTPAFGSTVPAESSRVPPSATQNSNMFVPPTF